MARTDSIDEESKVIVDLSDNVGMPSHVQRVTTKRPVVRLPTAPVTRSGPWLLVVVYVIAIAALAAAIYERFLL